MATTAPAEGIALTGTVCTEHHGTESNSATVYGHFGSLKTCVRITPGIEAGPNAIWVYDIRRAPTTTKKGTW